MLTDLIDTEEISSTENRSDSTPKQVLKENSGVRPFVFGSQLTDLSIVTHSHEIPSDELSEMIKDALKDSPKNTLENGGEY